MQFAIPRHEGDINYCTIDNRELLSVFPLDGSNVGGVGGKVTVAIHWRINCRFRLSVCLFVRLSVTRLIVRQVQQVGRVFVNAQRCSSLMK